MLAFLVFSTQVGVQEDPRRGWERAGPERALHQSGLVRWIREGECEQTGKSVICVPSLRRTAPEPQADQPGQQAGPPLRETASGDGVGLVLVLPCISMACVV